MQIVAQRKRLRTKPMLRMNIGKPQDFIVQKKNIPCKKCLLLLKLKLGRSYRRANGSNALGPRPNRGSLKSKNELTKKINWIIGLVMLKLCLKSTCLYFVIDRVINNLMTDLKL